VPYLAAVAGFVVTLVLSVTPAIHIPGGSGSDPVYPAPPGYVLPWAGGEIHGATQGEDTSFTHNGLAAYAIDFDLSYDTVVAARSGKVAMTKEDSNQGGCSAFYASSTNYVLIDHGDGTAALYMHLAYDSVQVEVGAEVRRGEALAVSGETGVTCSGETGLDPGAHLHFQVGPYEPGKYFTQSQPIAFDDIPTDGGVAVEGKSYVSGNYAPGKPQKIKLTPYRVSREFNPQAVPLHPEIVPAENPTQTPASEATATETPSPTHTPIPAAESYTEIPTETPTETPTPEPEVVVPTPEAPPPSATATDVVVPTPMPPTSTPLPTDTPVGATPTPEA
jgi:murein DD-endopeptidase MepM/ murein hydrolase activator NlpD